MILSLNPGMSYSVEENNVSLGQIKKKKKKKHFVSEEMWKKKSFVKCVFCFVWFGLVFLFGFVLFFCLFVFVVVVVVVVLVLMQNPLQPFPPSSANFVSFFLFLFSKNWENYCEQVSKNLGGGEAMKSPV